MSRRLVVCADGTWNTPGETDGGVPTPTNVCKMRDALVQDGTQLVEYHPGVGTGNWLDKLAGGGFGEGIDRNIQDLYRWLAQTYDGAQNDAIYLFGFSRGAYTVRSLAGFIRNCGLLDRDHLDKIEDAYRFYRDRTPLTAPDAAASQAFRAQYASEARDVTTTFIGVWDTVGALGIPIPALKWLDGDKYQFHDVNLSRTVRYAYHALAVDEERVPFAPCVWQSQFSGGTSDQQTLEQAWFAGVHSNIGGGYPLAGLSDLTFDWMRNRATAAGLVFKDDYATPVHTKPDYKLSDSMSNLYTPLGRIVRTIRQPREDDRGDPIATNESLHRSALERWENDSSYRAPNIKDYIMRFPTSDPGVITDT